MQYGHWGLGTQWKFFSKHGIQQRAVRYSSMRGRYGAESFVEMHSFPILLQRPRGHQAVDIKMKPLVCVCEILTCTLDWISFARLV